MAKIYVGCSLTQASNEFVQEVEMFKNLLRIEGHKVFDFVGTVKGTPIDVYENDIHQCVAECDILVAICDFPSIGLGWEIGTAVERHGKPVLAVAHNDAKVSRLPLGAECQRNQNYRFRRYGDLQEVVHLVSAFLKDINTVRV